MSVVASSHPRHWLNVALAAPLHTIVTWYKVSQERAALREMPSDRLADLGLTRCDVMRETLRPFWQAKRQP